MSATIFQYHIHPSLVPLLCALGNEFESDRKLSNSGSEPVFVSTYQPNSAAPFEEIIALIRRLEYANPFVALSFESQTKALAKVFDATGIIFQQLPCGPEELRQNLQNTASPYADEMLLAFRKAQKDYVQQKWALLHHGKELELLNSSLNPLRSACVNTVQGIGDGSGLRQLIQLIREDFLENPGMQEFLFCLDKIRTDDTSYLKLYHIFSGLESLLASLALQPISESGEAIQIIDKLMQDFRSLKTRLP